MAEYIERVKAIESICNHCQVKGNCQGECAEVTDLKAIPIADVAEVVHAHWEYYYDSLIETNLKCSQCGYKTNFKTKRCEVCDAKMDEEVHAHWIVTINKHIFPEEKHDPNFYQRCSNCGKTYGAYTKSEIYEMKECPRCKAKMDEKVN